MGRRMMRRELNYEHDDWNGAFWCGTCLALVVLKVDRTAVNTILDLYCYARPLLTNTKFCAVSFQLVS